MVSSMSFSLSWEDMFDQFKISRKQYIKIIFPLLTVKYRVPESDVEKGEDLQSQEPNA